MPHTPTPQDARLHAALRAVAGARLGAGLAALILALLLRLLARTEAAWVLRSEDEYEYAADEAGAYPYALVLPPMGRAPHAACIEAGLVPDWILPGIRNRGMRALPMAHPPSRHTLPVRAPPKEKPSPLGGLSREADQALGEGSTHARRIPLKYRPPY